MDIMDESKCPLVFISFVPIEEIFGERYLKSHSLKFLGKYDFNREETRAKLYLNQIDFKSVSSNQD